MLPRGLPSRVHIPLLLIGFFLCFCPKAPGQDAEPQGDNAKTSAKENDPLFPVVEHRKWGYMDKTGKIVIAPQYHNAYPFTEGIARIEPFAVIGARAIRVQFIDKTGQRLPLEQIYAYAEPFSEGMALVVVAGEKDYSYIDTSGKRVIEQDRSAGSFHEGLAAVGNGHKSGYIDKTGKIVIPLKFDNTQGFHEGLGAVEVAKKWGFVDKNGNEVIAPQYELAIPFHEGLAPVKVEGKWGYIEKSGKMVIAPQFTEAFGHCDGLGQVKVDGEWGFIDKTGQMVIPAKYDKANRHSEGLAGVNVGGKWGFVDTSGQMVVAPQFDDVGLFTHGLVEVKIGGKWGYIDRTGKYVWTPTD